MKIEAITTCFGCADFLAHTLPLNRGHFDRLIVVTAPEDEQTKRVCDMWSTEYHLTDASMSRWGLFCKGNAINAGLRLLARDQWMAHMDSDIILPSHFRAAVENADLDPAGIYGCDRQMFRSYADWMKFYEKPVSQIEEDLLIHPANGQRLGARVYYPLQGGWFPLGFFQLWHAQSGNLEYVAEQKDAGHDDAMFACKWPRKQRALIPEVIAYHLESEPLPMGSNWKQRQSKPFRHAD